MSTDSICSMTQTIRLFPLSGSEENSVSLSILDATVARFSASGAIWIYDSVSNNAFTDTLVYHLQASLSKTLNFFPHWAGQLQWTPFRHKGKYNERFGRPMVTYGTPMDPGIEWTVVKHATLTVNDLAPLPEERASSNSGIWIGDDFPQTALLSSTPLALHDLHSYKGLPGMTVQINLFPTGGYAIGIRIAHVLADAQALMVFVNLWSEASRELFGNSKPSHLGHPIFEPQMLDSRASGNIDAAEPDADIIKKARSLPLHRFDWYLTSSPGYPPEIARVIESTKPPADVCEKYGAISESTTAPWETWNFSDPVLYTLIHFPGTALNQLRSKAREEPHSRSDISRHDALLAFLWRRINRSRKRSRFSEDVFLNVTVGARSRVDPTLPPIFIGSPIFIIHVRSNGVEASTASMGELSTKIRDTISLITPQNVAHTLHDAAFELSPQRLWQAFLGKRHVLVTSWLRLDVYNVDFEGAGKKPRYVHPVMPKCDGIVVTIDSGVQDCGMDVALYLEEETMKTFLAELKAEM